MIVFVLNVIVIGFSLSVTFVEATVRDEKEVIGVSVVMTFE